MKLNLNYDECKQYITERLHLNLMPHQEILLKAWCDGKTVKTARGIGRSFVANALGKYIAYKFDKDNGESEPDILITYHCMVDENQMKESDYAKIKEQVDEDIFNRDFLCK